MKTLYAACLSRLGLSLQDAAALHAVPINTIKSWSSGRRTPDATRWDELREREKAIVEPTVARSGARPEGETVGGEGLEKLMLIQAANRLLGGG